MPNERLTARAQRSFRPHPPEREKPVNEIVQRKNEKLLLRFRPRRDDVRPDLRLSNERVQYHESNLKNIRNTG